MPKRASHASERRLHVAHEACPVLLPGRSPSGRCGAGGQLVNLTGLMMILELLRQGLPISVIAQHTGHDSKTRSQAHPPRACRAQVQAQGGTCWRAQRFPQLFAGATAVLTGSHLLSEIQALGYQGGKTILHGYQLQILPEPAPTFVVGFETQPGLQAQVDFADVLPASPSSARSGSLPWCWATAVTCGSRS